VLVSEAFAERNHLRPGDSLTAQLAGRRARLHVVGIALSPEYVMPLEPGAFASDDRRFALLWMTRAELEALLDMRGEFNDVAVWLAPGGDERAVIAALDRMLAPYGGRGAFGRGSQTPHRMLESHVQALKSGTLLIPTIFLLVAAFLVNVVITRVIATQREQIGMLKAFGYSDVRVCAHYLELTSIVILFGVAGGIPVGVWLGRALAEYLATFFRFPVLVLELEPVVLVGGAGIAFVTSVAGALGSLRRVAAMPPIVAMTPEVPAFRRTLLDRAAITPLLSASGRMIVRNLTKRPVRSVLSSAGMALAIAIVVLGRASGDGMNRMRDVQFQGAQREDVEITLAHSRALGTLHDILALPGVRRAEPYRLVAARLLAGGRREDIVLFGLREGSALRRAVDSEFRPAPRPGSGVIVTAWTARQLGLTPGDLLSIEIREGRRRLVTARLAGVVDEPLGEQGYMELGALGRLLGEPETYSGVDLLIDPVREGQLYARLKEVPQAVAIGLRRGTLATYRVMSDDAVTFVRGVELLFAVIIAFGVVYNTARITLAERGRELATLRVLGYTRGEAFAILLGEIGTLAAPAIPLGFAIGYALTLAVSAALESSQLRVPALVSSSTYAFAVVVFVVAALGSALVVRRRIDRLDLVEVLKAREA
jgi:putative ABC transport system permease protein